ncbi:hypothetical protein D917_03707 [Trichinella nativa]|uniref:Uncharacterized protein n=1 Tax=Trichinella nativa TaxID=6335 RepID=A0A1Y3E760_9BILA|nr:hypothetical protein D917_03707 [Trichinella nativa]
MPWPFGSDLPPGTLPDIPLSLTAIHVLIRLDAYFQALGSQKRKGRKNTPATVESIFGWIIFSLTAQSSMSSEETALLTQMIDDVAQLLLRFWEKVIHPGKHSKMERLVQITAYCVRFVTNARSSRNGMKSGGVTDLFLGEQHVKWRAAGSTRSLCGFRGALSSRKDPVQSVETQGDHRNSAGK